MSSGDQARVVGSCGDLSRPADAMSGVSSSNTLFRSGTVSPVPSLPCRRRWFLALRQQPQTGRLLLSTVGYRPARGRRRTHAHLSFPLCRMASGTASRLSLTIQRSRAEAWRRPLQGTPAYFSSAGLCRAVTSAAEGRVDACQPPPRALIGSTLAGTRRLRLLTAVLSSVSAVA